MRRGFWGKILNDKRGTVLLSVLVFGAVATMMIVGGVASYAVFENRASNRVNNRDLAFHIAEAGINYYRWHLAHNPTDYQDGTGAEGPYVHDYEDKNGEVVGSFSLNITAPLSGSSVVTIESTGRTLADPTIERTIRVRVGFPALTDYVFLQNGNMNFSFTTEVHGTIHSNGGIRFDGVTDSWVKSAKETYKYENSTHAGVWGGGGPKSFWQYPVPAIDFGSISSDISAIQKLANNGGKYLTSSGVEGWHIVFSGTNYSLYKVLTVDCYPGEGKWKHKWSGWYWDGTTYCYDIGTEQFVSGGSIPANGAFFSEDNVWVEGTVNGRVVVGVGKIPVQEPYKKIFISGNLLYAAKSSDDVVGLIAQGDILTPYEVPENMEIDAALLSQFGMIGRPFYDTNEKDSLLVFGSQISYLSGGWKYNNGWGNVISGFVNTNHTYDGNLKYFPPPGFPVGSVYELISWEEVK